ncbi:hypothetical protein OO007_18260 [Cocleimonas sp. KMM 6892]|uniref:hypothetical protein n=1 Tax=unclassified Cocleimonas TaxID=2639732 RepID=UPI002DBCABB4|nr:MULTISPECIES: hypothetical protein [unclassified Cocleimonas]MEB8434187.1 hypothetical protein [Cocleimonas sp. KMM 6892]MEC4716953.1 hypothetical protein [Cocleimonas sp. KMM 6895]MEC4746459.1 hypothetical protein [Cocleimonas sp. KMM 6896]
MRYKIALRNLYISQSIIILFLIFAYYIWFPYSFSELGGFFKTAWMLIFVDLILGPFLVFFIYKDNKKYLKFDINVLLAIQLIAFIFGAYSLYLKHPAYAVFNNDRFIITNVSNIYPKPSFSEHFKNYFFSKPDLVMINFPKDDDEKKFLAMEIVFGGQPDINSRTKYFEPLKNHIDLFFKKSLQLEELVFDTKTKKQLDLIANKHNGTLKDYAFFPLMGNNQKPMIWAFDKKTAKPVGIMNIDPSKSKNYLKH